MPVQPPLNCRDGTLRERRSRHVPSLCVQHSHMLFPSQFNQACVLLVCSAQLHAAITRMPALVVHIDMYIHHHPTGGYAVAFQRQQSRVDQSNHARRQSRHLVCSVQAMLLTEECLCLSCRLNVHTIIWIVSSAFPVLAEAKEPETAK